MLSNVFPLCADRITSLAFVGALSVLGAATVLQLEGTPRDLSAVTGAAQTAIEQAYAADNWLTEQSIPMIGALRYAVFGQGADGVHVGQEGWLFSTEELRAERDAQMHMHRNLERIVQITKDLQKQDITVLPVLIPDKAHIYAEQLGFGGKDVSAKRHDMALETLQTAGLAPLDGALALMSAKLDGQVFMQDDTHWSPLGAERVAQAVAVALARQDMHLPAAQVTTSKSAARDFDGDLLRFVPTGGLRPWVGPRQAQITPFVTQLEAQGGLFGDAKPEAALVGTSFSARADFNFVGFVQQALSADVINYAQEGRGPFAPMADFLAAEDLSESQFKLVLWEIPTRYLSKETDQ